MRTAKRPIDFVLRLFQKGLAGCNGIEMVGMYDKELNYTNVERAVLFGLMLKLRFVCKIKASLK